MTEESDDAAARARRAKYGHLPPPIKIEDTTTSQETELSGVEQGGTPDPDNGADPYLRITGWMPPR